MADDAEDRLQALPLACALISNCGEKQLLVENGLKIYAHWHVPIKKQVRRTKLQLLLYELPGKSNLDYLNHRVNVPASSDS